MVSVNGSLSLFGRKDLRYINLPNFQQKLHGQMLRLSKYLGFFFKQATHENTSSNANGYKNAFRVENRTVKFLLIM